MHVIRSLLLQRKRRGSTYELSQRLLRVEQRDCVDCKGTGRKWFRKCPGCHGSGALLDNQLWMFAHGYRAILIGPDGRLGGWIPKKREGQFSTSLEVDKEYRKNR